MKVIMSLIYKKSSSPPPPPPRSKKSSYFNNLRAFVHVFSKVFAGILSRGFAWLLKGWRVRTGAGVLRNISQSICKKGVQKLYIAISAWLLKGRALRNISKGICEKGVQKLKHAFCHTRVLQLLRAQSRTRFEPPFHKIIICFFSKTLCACARFLKGWRVQTGAGVLRNISQSFCKKGVQKLYIAISAWLLKGRALRSISKGICEKGVQKLKHAFCRKSVFQTLCAQSRTRFEPPFHKIIICFFSKTLCACARFLKGWRVQTGAGVLRNISQSICEKGVQKLYVAISAWLLKGRALRNISNSLCEKGVQKLKHAFCRKSVFQTLCAQSRTRFEPPFHKIIHAFSLFRHSRLERESSSRKAGLFVTVCSRLKGLFHFTMSRVQQINRVAGRACYFATGLSRLKSCFHFTLSRVQQINRVAGKACYFAAGFSRLKSLFCFTLSQVRQISRVAIPSPVGGFGLVDVMIAGAIGLTISMGMLKATQVSVVSNKVVGAAVAEQDLKRAIGQALGTPGKCLHNLRTFTAEDTEHSVSSLTVPGVTGALVTKAGTGTPASDGLFKTVLKIYEMKLKKATSGDTFKVYYTKENLGDYKTLPKADGTAGICTADTHTGCYSLSCNIEHDCPGTPAVCNGCALSNCTASQGDTLLYNVKCADGQSLKGFDSTGNKICEPFPKIDQCGSNQILRGFDSTGNKICVPPATVRCPPNLFLKGFSFDSDGTLNLDCACRGGQQLYERWQIEHDWTPLHYYYTYFLVGSSPYELHPLETVYAKAKVCLCPPEQGWKNGNCVTCGSGQKWDYHSQQCMTCSLPGSWRVTTSYGFHKRNTCRCPSDKKKKKVVQCILAYSYVRVGKLCHKGYVARPAKLIKAVYVA